MRRPAIGGKHAVDTFNSLHKGSWIANLVVAVAVLLISPLIGYLIHSEKGAWIAFCLGVGILFAILLIASFRMHLLSQWKANLPPEVVKPLFLDRAEIAKLITKPESTSAIVEDIPPSSTAAGQILREIRSARPFQKDELAKTFTNAPVRWTMPLSSISRHPVSLFWEGSVEEITVQLWEAEACVMFELPLAGNESLSLLENGALLTVRGFIKEVNPLWIKLKNASIEIPDDRKSIL